MRTLCGVGTPRSLQGHLAAVSVLVGAVWARVLGLWPLSRNQVSKKTLGRRTAN